MRLAISNIAWDIAEDDSIAALLKHYSIDAIDIAPGKYFPVPAKATAGDISRVKAWWGKHGVEIIGMQALLFGTNNLNMFGCSDTQDAMLAHFDALCWIGDGLDARRLVFGSPRNRDCTGLSNKEILDIAIPFFGRLGDIALSHRIIICLEPNPACYGANFMTTAIETANIVGLVRHPAIKMQLDTGALTIHKEDIKEILPKIAHLIGHIHISEPDLLPIGDGNTPHADIADILENWLPDHTATIEMLATEREPHQISIRRALEIAIDYYRRNRSSAQSNQ
ncbi:sugar phosphate isomerase/epimerase family protein [Acerihabitans arboris]|uniref:TIM barrel protein n=1 Tax=Acerihabitans arboris TaxID=2691583 RepID=A0A845SJE8_9GAMM|nr:TIM barrel protein [Acerihabitans arboris]NDL63136.1 TIM barrel protein [Acerihabitans arboris]